LGTKILIMNLEFWAQKYLHYQFQDIALLKLALTHKSASAENNERLEFIGDSVLGMIISLDLYSLKPNELEGALTRLRAHLVNGKKLSEIAQEIMLGDQIILGQGELKSGSCRQESILSNCFEAVIGAIYLDGGFNKAKEVIAKLYDIEFAKLPQSDELKDPKTKLQELLQSHGKAIPEYSVVTEFGDPHQRSFRVMCKDISSGKSVKATATSIKKAEQMAAADMLNELVDE